MALKKNLWRLSSGPILEFKGSVQYNQKRHPNMVTQIDISPKLK